MDAIEKIEYKGHTINIFQDDHCESPDVWHDENLFLVGFHRDFTVEREGITEGLIESIFAARRLALGLVETWNEYLSGNVYGYVIDEDGESCWGFYWDIYENMYMHGKRKDGDVILQAKEVVDNIDPKEYAKAERLKKIDALRTWEKTLTTEERETVSRSIKSIEKQLTIFSGN